MTDGITALNYLIKRDTQDALFIEENMRSISQTRTGGEGESCNYLALNYLVKRLSFNF